MKSSVLKFIDLKILKYLIIGFLFAATIHIVTSCSKDNPVEPDPIPPPPGEVNEEKIHEGALAIENAFLSGNPSQVNTLFTETALSIYEEYILNVSPVELKKFGEALKTRKLDVYGDLYAEYNYTYKGETYSIGLAQQDDETWKLMRF